VALYTNARLLESTTWLRAGGHPRLRACAEAYAELGTRLAAKIKPSGKQKNRIASK